MNNLEKKVAYVDMDFTLCDFEASYLQYKQQHPEEAFPHSVSGFFIGLAPMLGANPHSYTEKRLWVEKHLGINAAYKLIISPNKGLNKGHYLIDDYTEGKGQENFEGKILQFGSKEFPDWKSVQSFFERGY
jgi:5'-nucleotidase